MSQLGTTERFSLATILATMTTFGVLFGGLRMINADTPVYLYFGLLAMATVAAQMAFGVTSKLGSALLGGILLPTSLLGYSVWRGDDIQSAATGLPCAVLLGAVLGFCTAAMSGGVFTLLQMAQGFVRPRRQRPATASDPNEEHHE